MKAGKRREEVLDAVARNGGNKAAAAKELGLNPSTVSQHVKLELRREKRGKNGQVTSQEFGTPRGPAFEPRDGEVFKKRTVQVDGEGRIIQQWLKPELSNEDLRKALKEVFSEIRGAAYDGSPPPQLQHGDLLQVYPLADQHVGLLAWGRETGEDYDLAIGERRLRDVSERLVSGAPAAKHALILGLGDYFHVDDEGKATPASKNRLDGDGRHYKILKTGVRMLKDFISTALTRHAHVTVVNLPGNHDPHAKMVLDVGLAEAYIDHPRVTIIEQPGRWYFHKFGVNLLGSTHGDETKPDGMVLRMAEHPDWSSSPHRVFYYGHFHRDQSRTVGSCRTVCVPTITSHDAWGAGKGFTARKAMVGTTYHLHEGEIMSQRVNV